MICYGDAFTGQYRDEKALVEAIIGRLMIEAHERKWGGVILLDAVWMAKSGDFAHPICVVAIGPGHGGAITVAAVRDMIRQESNEAAA